MSDNGAANESGVSLRSLLKYFMNHYKVQLGLPRDTASEIVFVEPSRQYPKLSTYELFVEHKGEQLSRRVTLGPIAEETGSKSTCFLAIYDSKVVIKIPPKPINWWPIIGIIAGCLIIVAIWLIDRRRRAI